MLVSTFSMLIIAAPRIFVKGAVFFCPAQRVRRETEKAEDSGTEKTGLFLLLYTRPQKTLSKWTGF